MLSRGNICFHCGCQVKAILVNIFGGIVNCATIANGIISACKEIQLSIPLVVRLEGKRYVTIQMYCILWKPAYSKSGNFQVDFF
jgi:hypothetical protein